MYLPVSLTWAFALTLALVFGSFLNVCISRLPDHRSVTLPASHCPHCKAPIRPRDNLPVLSWLLLRGRCRDCRHPISPRYPLVEAGYAALVALCLACYGFTCTALAAAVFCFLVLGLLVMDLETMLLPDAFTLPGLALGLTWAFALPFASKLPGASFQHSLLLAFHTGLAAAAWALILLIIRGSYYAVRRRQGLGMGDVKLVAMLGAWLGVERTGLTFFLAVIAAAATGVVILLSSRPPPGESSPATAKQPWQIRQLPLGAFLCVAALYSFFLGEATLRWYFSLWP